MLSELAEAGLERTANSSGKTPNSEKGGAKSGAVDARQAVHDPDLAELLHAWPDLTPAARAGILKIVRRESAT